MTYSEYTKWLRDNDKGIYADKSRATDNADEIIKAAKDYINEGLKHPRKDNIKDFARGTVLLRIGGADYSAEVVVGTTSSGEMLLYDIVNMQKTKIQEKDGHTIQPNLSESRRSGASVSDESVSQPGDGVNTNFSLKGTEHAGSSSDLEVLRAPALEMARESIRRGDLGPVPEIPPRPVQQSPQEILSRLAREMTQDPTTPPASLSDEDIRAMPDEIYQIPEVAEVKKRPYSPTNEINTQERAQLRRDILGQLYAKGSHTGVEKDSDGGYNGPIRQERRADIVIGVPAAGKSSVLVNPLSRAHGSRVIDSDMAKVLLPEYDGGKGADDVHRESSAIRDALLKKAVGRGNNIVWPQVGKNLDALRADILSLKNAGYRVYLHLNQLPAGKAAGRALNRFLTDGRYVDSSLIMAVGDAPTINYQVLRKEGGLLDGYSWYSNDVPFGAEPVLIEDSASNGGVD